MVVSQSESELPVNRGKEEESDSEEQNAQNQMEIEDDDATLIFSSESDDNEEFTSVKELEGIHDAVQDNYEEWRTAKEIPKNPPGAPKKPP